MAAAAVLLPTAAHATSADSSPKSLEDLKFGEGKWAKMGRSGSSRVDTQEMVVPASFSTYMARFLINYDQGVSAWWINAQSSGALLSDEQQKSRLGRAFGGLSSTIQVAMNTFIQQKSDVRDAYDQMFNLLIEKYNSTDGALRQIILLGAMLPADQQPVRILHQLVKSLPDTEAKIPRSSEGSVDSLQTEFASLLPESYTYRLTDGGFYTLEPAISLFEVGFNEEFGQTAIATSFGPLSSTLLTRELPRFSFNTYALFGFSGATGCALTHSIVIPLDVVKTKAQTDPEEFSDILKGATKVVEKEGIQGLLTGAQATLAGYFWYGLSVSASTTTL